MTHEDSLIDARPMSASLLPEFDPDPALWERILSGNDRRLRRRRNRRFAVLGVCLAVVVVFGLRVLQPAEDVGDGVHAVADVRMESQDLQDALRGNGNGRVDSIVQSRLRLLDRDLQAAYDHGAGDAELQALWTLRKQLLEALVEQDSVSGGHRFTRI